MGLLKILDIGLTIPKGEALASLNADAENHDPKMVVSMEGARTRFTGQDIMKITASNPNNDSLMTIAAEYDNTTGILNFRPMRFKSMDDSFYQVEDGSCDVSNCNEGESAEDFFMDWLQDQAILRKGRLVYIDHSGYGYIVIDGNTQPIEAYALIDKKGHIFSSVPTGQQVVMDHETASTFQIITPINQWIKEHPDVQEKLKQIPDIGDKMDFIGQYLICARLNDDIDSIEFMDIFKQAGTLGFKKPSVQNIYKLIT